MPYSGFKQLKIYALGTWGKIMYALIQKKYGFTDYQIAQLKYTFTILFSEISKFVILAFLFRNHIVMYLYAAVLLGILRPSSGGLHAKTYWGCLFMSFLFFCASIYLLPQIGITKIWMVVLIIGCAAAIALVGPVESKYRKPPTDHMKKRLVAQSLIIILIHLILFCLNDSEILAVGNWIIIVQVAQLTIAKIYKEVKS